MGAERDAAGTLLIVDGAGVCRAPIVEFALRERLTAASWLADTRLVTRGLAARPDDTMCPTAQVRIGNSGPAFAYLGAYRARRLTRSEIAGASLVITAEREQRSAVVRRLPGTQTTVFTWKEALVLSSVLADRVAAGAVAPPSNLGALALAMHSVRGTVPLIEPPVRTGVFHLRRAEQADPLTVPDGHAVASAHRGAVQESWQVALGLADALTGATAHPVRHIGAAQQSRSRRQRA